MSKQTTFQELRHKCAELYCPKDWTINLWADFFGDCMKLHVMNEADRKEAIDEISKCYSCDEIQVVATVAFQKDNGILGD